MNMNFFNPPLPRRKAKGFTLAETLITIMVIGIVAAIMIPALSYLIQARVREHQVDVAQKKFNKAAEMMTLNGKMGPYYSNTLDFVSELQNHFKITKVCRVGSSPSALPPVTDCFGDNYETITINSNGDTVNLSDIKTAADLGIDKADDENDWTSDNIAILTIDGTRMILTYNSKCSAVDPGIYEGNTSYACIAGVADVDGDKKPNTLDKDVYLFGSAESLGSSCAIGSQVGLCYGSLINAGDIQASKGLVTESECYANASDWGITDIDLCSKGGNANWLATFARECGGVDNIMSAADFAKIVNYVWGISGYPTDTPTSYSRENGEWLEIDDTIAARLAEFGIPNPKTNRTPKIWIYAVASSGLNQNVRVALFADDGMDSDIFFIQDNIATTNTFCKK